MAVIFDPPLQGLLVNSILSMLLLLLLLPVPCLLGRTGNDLLCQRHSVCVCVDAVMTISVDRMSAGESIDVVGLYYALDNNECRANSDVRTTKCSRSRAAKITPTTKTAMTRIAKTNQHFVATEFIHAARTGVSVSSASTSDISIRRLGNTK